MSVSVSQCLPGQSHQRSTHLKWGSQASAPSLPHPSFCAKLMSTTDSLDFKAVAKAWPWNAFRVESWCKEYCGSLNSKRLISKYLEYIQVSKKTFLALRSRRAKWIRPTHQTRLNVFKHHLPCLYASAVFETGSKSLSRTTTKEINPLCLDAFDTDAAVFQIQAPDRSIDLQHLRQILAAWNCARQLFDFTLDSHRSIYSPWNKVHRTSAPSSPQPGLPAKLMSTTDLLDFKAVAKAWRPWKTFRAIQFWCLHAEKSKFYALISECLDLKDSSKMSFLSTNQNRCKILEDHMMPKSRCPRIALKCWYYHYQ